MNNFSQEDTLKYLDSYLLVFSFIIDKQLQLVKTNKAFDNLFLPSESNNLSSIITDQGKKKLIEAFEGKIKRFRLNLISSHKKSVILDVEINVLKQRGKQYLHVLGFDITDSVKNELLVDKYRLIAKKTTSGVIITDALGYTTWVNNGFTKMTGYGLDEIFGKKPGALLQGEETDVATVNIMREAINHGRPFEVDIINYHKNGKKIWISIICDPFFNKRGELEGFVAIQPEITKRKLLEQKELKKNHDKFEAVFCNAINAIILANNEMECIDVNPAACEMLGYSKTEFVGKSIGDITKNGDLASELWNKFIEDGKLEGEIELLGKNEIRTKARYYAISNILQDTHLSILLDITEKEIMQEELIKKNDELILINQEKNKLFSIISHDLRSPLSRLAGLLDLIRDSDLSQEEFLNFAGELSDDVNDTANLLNNLLIWSNAMLEGIKVKPVVFDLKILADEQLNLQNKNALRDKITLENHIETATSVFADKNMINIVLRNLISNAIKFCNENATITLTAQHKNNEIVVCVADTGVGILKENQQKIFSNNFTTKGTKNERGNGIGLKLCKDFIEQNNGKIWVESELNKGSKFFFTLGSR